MLQFDTGEKIIEVDRDGLEAIAQEQLVEKIGELRQAQPGVYSTVKAAVDIMLMTNGVKVPVPKDVNKLEFLACYFMKIGIDMIDNKPIPVKATVKEKEGEADGANDHD